MRASPGRQVVTAFFVLVTAVATVVFVAVLALSDSGRVGVASMTASATFAVTATPANRLPNESPEPDALKPTALTQMVGAAPTVAPLSDVTPLPAVTQRPVLPPATVEPAVTPTPSVGPTSTQTSTDGACTNPDSRISYPPVGAVLQGVVEFRGTARLPSGFDYYKFEIRPDRTSTATDFVTIDSWQAPVSDGVLMRLDTQAFPNGTYWIRLVVADTTGNYPERCSNLYNIRN